MNTRILLATAGAAALSACQPTPEPQAWEFPLVEATRPVVKRQTPPPKPVFNPAHDPYRVPDVTEQLPNHRNRPNPNPPLESVPDEVNPLAVIPPTPPPTAIESPPVAPPPIEEPAVLP